MKRLVVCCDGTWNNAEQEKNGVPSPTNVFKLHNAIADKDPQTSTDQQQYYHPGVGGEHGLVQAISGGAVGVGISRHVTSAYHWLGTRYEEGDHIFLYGFSRGAFTARSLGGFLGHGLLNLRGLPPKEAWERVHAAYLNGFRVENSSRTDWAKDDWEFFQDGQPAPIQFLGVWDTVGALGVPDDLELINLLDQVEKWRFFDTRLGPHVRTARHAMAIDEVRSSFSIARWSNAQEHPDADVKEVWFPGVHSDVGGGYSNCDLSNGALLWMMEESEKAGLVFRESAKVGLKADPLGTLHNSYKGPFAKLRSRPRRIDAMIAANRDLFHPSAFDRQRASPIAYPLYHPTKVLDTNESCTVNVFADTRWNYTTLYLEKGHCYLFSATGEWQDAKDSCDWRGTENADRTLGDLIRASGDFLEKFESAFKKVSNNEATDFLGTKRVAHLPWFALVGAIANDGGLAESVANDGSPVPHQYVGLAGHDTTPLEIENPGYLYCFANDVWSLYGNNSGSVQLTVKRVE